MFLSSTTTRDMLIMTSFYEGMSNAVLEAMSAGLPCMISSSFSSSISFFENNQQLVYSDGNHGNLVQKVCFFYADFNLRKNLGKESRNYILNLNKITQKEKWKKFLVIKSVI